MADALSFFNNINTVKPFKWVIIAFVVFWSIALMALYHTANDEDKEDIKYTNSVIIGTLIVISVILIITDISLPVEKGILSLVKDKIKTFI